MLLTYSMEQRLHGVSKYMLLSCDVMSTEDSNEYPKVDDMREVMILELYFLSLPL